MFLFKTSGATLHNVVRYQKHAFRGRPREWLPGEVVLVSKNRADCGPTERQIQFTMELVKIRPLQPGESEQYWPGTEGRWRYLFECAATKRLARSFDLADVLGSKAAEYQAVMTFKRLSPEHAYAVERVLQ